MYSLPVWVICSLNELPTPNFDNQLALSGKLYEMFIHSSLSVLLIIRSSINFTTYTCMRYKEDITCPRPVENRWTRSNTILKKLTTDIVYPLNYMINLLEEKWAQIYLLWPYKWIIYVIYNLILVYFQLSMKDTQF